MSKFVPKTKFVVKKRSALICTLLLISQYMETALTLPMFGYVHFAPCVCDYPASNTPAHVAVGRRELVMKVRQGATGELKEGSFKVGIHSTLYLL